MKAELSFNLGPKEHAVAAQKLTPPAPEQAQLAGKAVEAKGEKVEREGGLRWNKEEAVGRQDELTLSFESTAYGPTTVVTPESVAAAGKKEVSRRVDLKGKLANLLGQNYALSFHHNRLVAKVAEWTIGNITERLARLGMSVAEISALKEEIRQDLIRQNRSALAQVVYDEKMLEIIT